MKERPFSQAVKSYFGVCDERLDKLTALSNASLLISVHYENYYRKEKKIRRTHFSSNSYFAYRMQSACREQSSEAKYVKTTAFPFSAVNIMGHRTTYERL